MRTHSSGLTLVESVVALAIFSFIVLATSQMSTVTYKAEHDAEEALQKTGTNMIITKQITQDLRNASPSFATLFLESDESTKPNFFSHLIDQPCREATCSRSLKIVSKEIVKLGGKGRTEFVFFITRSLLGEALQPILFPPSLAYSVGKSPNYTTDGTLTYNVANLFKAMNDIQLNPQQFFKDKTLVQFYAPVNQRPMTTTGLPDLTNYSRPLTFVGQVSGGDFEAFSIPVGISTKLQTTHPGDINITINTLDKFFKTLPAFAGMASFSKARPIQMVKYHFDSVSIKGKPVPHLYRSIYDGNAFSAPIAIGIGVDSIEFTRNSINNSVVNFKINMGKYDL